MRRLRRPILVIFALLLASEISGQEKCFRIGTNIQPSNNIPLFINVFMQSRTFVAMPNHWGLTLHEVMDCDPNGYPLRVPDNAYDGKEVERVAKWINSGDGPMLKDSVYILRWDGTGEMRLSSWGKHEDPVIIDSSENHFEFLIPEQKNYAATIISSQEGDHVRNIRLCLKSQEDLYEVEKKVFNPYVLEILEPFYMFRFMGAFNTNNSPFRSWEDRTRTDWYHWKGHQNCGLAYEYAARLCNEAKAHVYFNVPHAADEYSIRKMAELLRDKLDPDLDVYLEYSNETWNGGRFFKEQFDYVIQYGEKLRPDLREFRAGVYGHAMLSKRVYEIWREVFGRDSLRVRRTYLPWGGHTQNYINDIGPENFDVLSGAFYWAPTRNEYSENWDEHTTLQEMIDAAKHNITQGWFYQGQKKEVEVAKLYGKELFHKEGGYGRDPVIAGLEDPVDWLDTFRTLQTHPVMLELQQMVMDTLTSLGVLGGCELTLTGGWCNDPPGRCTWGCSQWGTVCENLLTASQHPERWPKLQGYYNNMKDCDKFIRETDTIGAGLTIRLDGNDDYVDFPNSFKPDDAGGDYAVEFWIRPEMAGVDQYIFSMATGLGASSNSLVFTEGQRLQWNITNAAGSSIARLETPPVETEKWHHVMVNKQGTAYTLYIDGIVRATALGTPTGDCSRSRLVFGADIGGGTPSDFFRGRIDEIRIWETGAITVGAIRDWMCRKVASEHPAHDKLRCHYRFDEADVAGSVKEEIGGLYGQLHGVTFTKYSNYEKSGAPIGSRSVQTYPTSWDNVALGLSQTGSRFSVFGLGDQAPLGVHTYVVDQRPSESILPGEDYYYMADRYYGVFVVGEGAPDYRVSWKYTGDPEANPEPNLRLLAREETGVWSNTGAGLDVDANALTTRRGGEIVRGEYILTKRRMETKTVSGPGTALRFDTTGMAYGEALPFERPDGEYTVSCWFKTEVRTDGGYLFIFANGTRPPIPGWAKTTRVYVTGGGVKIKLEDIDFSSESMSLLNMNGGWNHIAVTRKDSRVTVYCNGLPTPGLTDINIGAKPNGEPRDVGLNRLYVGYEFKGVIDELQVWDKALSQEQIRRWMCKKPGKEETAAQTHCVARFSFDDGAGEFAENERGGTDLRLFGPYEWVNSGAALGDTSTYIYGSGEGFDKHSIAHPDGDRLSVDMSEEKNRDRYHGYHLYRVDGAPGNTTFPIQDIRSADTTKYYGIFVVHKTQIGYPHSVDYALRYSYVNNPNIQDTRGLRLLSRSSAEGTWIINDVAPDTNNSSIELRFVTKEECNGHRCAVGTEILLGATTDAISVDDNAPAKPENIVGKTVVCAGQTNVTYSVSAVSGADYYVWETSDGLNGFSKSDSIRVSVSPDAEGSGTISVRAGNRWAESPEQVLEIVIKSTPSLSSDIKGPSEVCGNQLEVEYSIAPVTPEPSQYIWQSTGEASIDGNGPTAKVSFGSQNVTLSVYGRYADCGDIVLGSKPIVVNPTPRTDLNVIGGTICRGIVEEAAVAVYNSELGVEYRAYRNNGASPVGPPVYGTGGLARILIRADELLPGDNYLTVKARKGNCIETALQKRAVVRIDAAPDPNTRIEVRETDLCPDDSVHLIIRNTQPGVTYIPVIWRELTIDNPNITEHEPFPLGAGEDIEYVIPPSKGHAHFAGRGVNIGKNKIWFKAMIGSCPTVSLVDTVDITVNHSPHIIQDEYLSMTRKEDEFIEDTVGLTVLSHSAEIGNQARTITMCDDQEIVMKVLNADLGAEYAAYLTRVGDSSTQVLLSDTVQCTQEGGAVTLVVPPDTLPAGEVRVGIQASNGTCKAFIACYIRATVEPSPDRTLEVLGQTVCPDERGIVIIRNPQENVRYRARVLHDGHTTNNRNGNGEDLEIRIPATHIRRGANKVVIEASNSICGNYVLLDTAVIANEDIDVTLRTEAEASDLCVGNESTIFVHQPQQGLHYSALIDGRTVTDSVVVAEGDTATLRIRPERLRSYAGSSVTVTIHARTAEGGCRRDLNETVALNISSSESGGYPVFDIEDRTTHLEPNPWIGVICPGNGSTVTVQFSHGGMYEGLRFQGTVNGVPVGEPCDPVGEEHFDLGYPREHLPSDSSVRLGLIMMSDGCRPQPVVFKRWSRIREDFEVEILPTVDFSMPIHDAYTCGDESGTIRIENVPVGQGFVFRLYDPVYDRVVCEPVGDGHWNYDRHGFLPLPVFDRDILRPGANEFEVQVRPRKGEQCDWVAFPRVAVVYVNVPPRRDLEVEGSSVCSGDGSITIHETEGDTVTYTPFMAGIPVASPKAGTGEDLNFVINDIHLAEGSNEITIQAQRAGCPPVVLYQTAIIQRVDAPPGKPSVISGPGEVCANQVGVEYSVPNDRNALSYTWNLPDGATASSNTNSALIDFGSTGGEIIITANNACGPGEPSEPLTVNVTPSVAGGTVTGPANGACGEPLTLVLSGQGGTILKWQWSQEVGIWHDIPLRRDRIEHTPGDSDVTYRAVIDGGECGLIRSASHTVSITPCAGGILPLPQPNPEGGSYPREQITVYFEPTSFDEYQDIYYVICSDFSRCSMEDARVYNAAEGIVLEIGSEPKGIRYQARPKPEFAAHYTPSSVGEDLYVYSIRQLGVPVPVPGGGSKKTPTVQIQFEDTDQSDVRQIYYTICDDTAGCVLTEQNRMLFDPTEGVRLNILDGPKAIAYQAVPLGEYVNEYQNSIVGKALYTYRPGLLVRRAAYFDADGDGRIDEARVAFESELPQLPGSILLRAPYDLNESAEPTPTRLSISSVLVPLGASEFEKVFTGFDPGPFGKVFDQTGVFDTAAFEIVDSVAPVILSATYAVAEQESGGTYHDTLRVTFSEPVQGVGDEPFVFFGPSNQPALTGVTTEGSMVTALIPVSSTVKTAPVKTGDMVAVRTSGATRISDMGGAVQDNPQNRRVPITVTAPGTFSLHYGPTLFRPGIGMFRIILGPGERMASPDPDARAKITMFDRTGNVVLRRDFKRNSDNLEFVWDGTNRNGRLVGQATYIAILSIQMNGVKEEKKIKIGVKRE